MPYTQDGLPWAPQSDTSHQAAVRAQSFAATQQAKVLAHIAACGARGCTQPEAVAALGIKQSSGCARFRELEKAGRIYKTPTRRDGCQVYEVTA